MFLSLHIHSREFQSLPPNIKKNWKLLHPHSSEQFFQALSGISHEAFTLLLPLNVHFPNGERYSAQAFIREIRQRNIWLPILVMGFSALVGLLKENPDNLMLCSPRVHYLRYFTEIKDWNHFLAQMRVPLPSAAEMQAYLTPATEKNALDNLENLRKAIDQLLQQKNNPQAQALLQYIQNKIAQ